MGRFCPGVCQPGDCKDDQDYYFWGTHTGAEVDFFWQAKGKSWAIEFKYMDAPRITKSMRSEMNGNIKQ